MQPFRVEVKAGKQARPPLLLEVPVRAELPDAAVCLANGKRLASELRKDSSGTGGTLLIQLPGTAAGEQCSIQVGPADEQRTEENGVRFARTSVKHVDGAVEIELAGRLFTSYRYDGVPRPFFFPLLTSTGVNVTRSWPMEPGPAGEDQDHPHHRGLWVAHGDVNGADNWHAGAVTRHVRFSRLHAGGAAVTLDADGEWRTNEGLSLLRERRSALLYDLPDGVRVVDITLTLQPTAGDVRFGDTKEGGICSVRVASSMTGTRGGIIETAAGCEGEKQSWGSRAAWCDYSGQVDGKSVGVAILDHPSNFRHPTYWHVRDYGLMTANPFGVSAFTADPARDGSHTLPEGESMTFKHRVLVHEGDASAANVAGHYENWIHPPAVTISRS